MNMTRLVDSPLGQKVICARVLFETYSFANSPLNAANAPLAMASVIHRVTVKVVLVRLVPFPRDVDVVGGLVFMSVMILDSRFDGFDGL